MKTIGATVYAGAILMAAAVSAAEQSIPTPAPSVYVDTESSVNVPLPDWPDLGRRVKIDLTAYATPSNAIQIAFGQDTNGDEDLEPEETLLVIGVDCGVPFVRDERGSGFPAAYSEDDSAGHSSTSTFNFNFKQPQAVSDRITHAKVTTRGREDTAAQIAAEVRKPGLVLLLR